MILRTLYISILSLAAFCKANAQEFNCSVVINTPKLQTADPKVFKTLTTAITQFLNERKWSDDTYKAEERIDVSIQINVDQELSGTRFAGQLLIQSSRPVYNSSYSSVLLEMVDKDVIFDYQEYEALDFGDNQFTSNLTSILAYYAYVILGLDGDSFSEMGGEAYFQKAQTVLNNVPQNVSDKYPGWKPFTSQRNRYWLIENILNVRMKGLRSAMYAYHLGGLDMLSSNPTQGQTSIKKALDDVKKANNDYPATMLVQLFAQAKRDEIVNVFTPADMRLKQEVFDMMTKLDPTNSEQYRKLLK